MILKKETPLNRLMKNHKGKGQLVPSNHLKLKVNWLLSFSQNKSCHKKAQKKFQLLKKVLENKVLVSKGLLRRERKFMTRLYPKRYLINFLMMKMSTQIISLKINLIINLMKILKFRVSKLLDCSLPRQSFIRIIS